jgi:hypothetical protein
MATGRFFGILTAGLALSCGTGCGALSALTNPKAAWALQEPAPMAVILRRADAARMTATNVDRLLSSTAVNPGSQWIPKVGMKKADAEASLKEIGNDPDYAVPPAKGGGGKLRVVSAEAWAKGLSTLCSHESRFPNIIAHLSPDLATSYAEIAGQSKAVAKLKADKEAEVKALDQSDISASDRDLHEKKKRDIEDQIDKLEADYRPKVDTFLSKLRDAAGSASPEAKKQLPVVLVALKHAVEDAKLANSVALLRYPLAMPGMPQELKNQAKRIIADVVEDRTGHRPTLDKLDPDVKLEGGEVKITLNGMPPDALAGIKPEAILLDVTTRSKDYVLKVLTLTAYVAETEEMLELESSILKNAMDGLSVDESGVHDAGDDLADLKVELDAASGAKAGKSTRHPVPTTVACGAGVAVKVEAKGKGEKTDKAASTPAKTAPASAPASTPTTPRKKGLVPGEPLVD